MGRFSRYVAAFHRTPNYYRDPLGYASTIASIACDWAFDAVLPTHEDVIALLAHRKLLPSSLVIASPSMPNVMLGLDKGQLARAALEWGIPLPPTLVPASIQEARFYLERTVDPMVVKPRSGNGGMGVHVLTRHQGRGQFYQEYCRRNRIHEPRLPIIQHYVEGPVVGCGFVSIKGKLAGFFTERYLRSKSGIAGPSVLREPIEEDRVASLAKRFCEAAEWDGIGHMDFILPKHGGPPLLIDVNPRLWGALSLAVASGMNFPLAALAVAGAGGGVQSCLTPASKRLQSQWIAGELMLCAEHIRARRWTDACQSIASLWPSADKVYDDFSRQDPVPLAAELLNYAVRYCRGRIATPCTSSLERWWVGVPERGARELNWPLGAGLSKRTTVASTREVK